jgi:hypothetical protein
MLFVGSMWSLFVPPSAHKSQTYSPDGSYDATQQSKGKIISVNVTVYDDIEDSF